MKNQRKNELVPCSVNFPDSHPPHPRPRPPPSLDLKTIQGPLRRPLLRSCRPRLAEAPGGVLRSSEEKGEEAEGGGRRQQRRRSRPFRARQNSRARPPRRRRRPDLRARLQRRGALVHRPRARGEAARLRPGRPEDGAAHDAAPRLEVLAPGLARRLLQSAAEDEGPVLQLRWVPLGRDADLGGGQRGEEEEEGMRKRGGRSCTQKM